MRKYPEIHEKREETPKTSEIEEIFKLIRNVKSKILKTSEERKKITKISQSKNFEIREECKKFINRLETCGNPEKF